MLIMCSRDRALTISIVALKIHWTTENFESNFQRLTKSNKINKMLPKFATPMFKTYWPFAAGGMYS